MGKRQNKLLRDWQLFYHPFGVSPIFYNNNPLKYYWEWHCRLIVFFFSKNVGRFKKTKNIYRHGQTSNEVIILSFYLIFILFQFDLIFFLNIQLLGKRDGIKLFSVFWKQDG